VRRETLKTHDKLSRTCSARLKANSLIALISALPRAVHFISCRRELSRSQVYCVRRMCVSDPVMSAERPVKCLRSFHIIKTNHSVSMGRRVSATKKRSESKFLLITWRESSPVAAPCGQLLSHSRSVCDTKLFNQINSAL
jgi:hypothetical protein